MKNKPSLQQNCLCFFANKNFVFITKQGFEEPLKNKPIKKTMFFLLTCFLRVKAKPPFANISTLLKYKQSKGSQNL